MKHPARISLALAITLAAAARGDSVYKFGVNGQPQLAPLYRDVTVLRVDDDKLIVRSRTGGDVTIPLASVIYVDAANDAVFTAADQAFAARDFDKAIDGYAKIVRGADQAWKTRYVAPRMLLAATKSGRFDAAIDAWIAVTRTDPTAAAAAKPTLPATGSRYLDDAAKSLDAAARAATTDAQRQTLLAFELEVELARGAQPAVDAVTERLAALTNVAGADPKLGVVTAETRLTQARAAMQSKKYDAAIAAIDSAAPLLADPGQQAEALFLIAEARAALADASGDAGARRDAAIAYLRVVANLSAEPSAAGFVTRSMLAAARLQAAVGDVAAARALYDQLRGEYPDSPVAAQAAALSSKLPTSDK